MKIVCLIREEAPLIYFVNKIHEIHKVSLVIVESYPFKKRILLKIQKGGTLSLLKAIVKRVLSVNKRKVLEKEYNRILGNRRKSLEKNILVLVVDDINSQIVFKRLQQEQPDLILVHGTALVKECIAETARLALNLHWGLSPYYRGTGCTEWALINWDPYNIGVTIHKLANTIDGGDIAGQERISVESQDTVNSINVKLTHAGTDLLNKIIQQLKDNKQIIFKKQNYSLGFLFSNAQRAGYISDQVEYIEKNHLIELMLKRPARKLKLPIVELTTLQMQDIFLGS